MITKIKAFLKEYLDLIVGIFAIILAFVLGQIVKFPGPQNKGEPRHFKDFQELNDWYNSRFILFWTLLKGDCDDRADYVRRCALADGFVLSLQLIGDGKIHWLTADSEPLEIKVSNTTTPHCGLLAICGNEFWYIEHNDNSFCFIVNRD